MNINTMKEYVHTYMDELTYSIVAESGKITDRYHIGKILLRSFKSAPDFLMQIDGATGETDTFKSALERSIKCAICFRNLGIKPNDNIVIMGPNGLDLTMPMYASFYLGAAVVAVDMTLGPNELEDAFKDCAPKIVFCQSENAINVQKALKSLKFDTHIFTFGEIDNFVSFKQLIKKYSFETSDIDNFVPNEFDPRITNLLLIATSGSTGTPKVACVSYENLCSGFADCMGMYSQFPTPYPLAIVPSPLQWMTANYHFLLSPILRYTRLQTSLPFTPEHGAKLIQKYKPTYMIANPNYMSALLKYCNHDKCDLSSLKHVILTGSLPSKVLMGKLKKEMPNAVFQGGYGITEATGFAFNYTNSLTGSCGKPIRRLEYKLVDYETEKEICEPNQRGELWLKGKSIFKGYYNKPEITADTLTKDGWLKTGDIFYRDESDNYFYVDRLKMLLKYNNHHISPIEIENVILTHPGIFEAAVTGIPSPDHGELPVAIVVPDEGSTVTADEIKELVKNSLTDTKQLRGGVIFTNNLPKTATGKLNRKGLKKFVEANGV